MGTEVPICLHPTTLTQLLQFWVPQTAEFEEALLSIMRLPTVLSLLDGDTERISLKILNALSTFENIGNLPPETTTRVLLNDALRQKLKVEEDIAKQVELVREALIEENNKTEQRLIAEKLRSSQLQQDGEKLHTEVQGLKAELERQRAEADESKATVRKTEESLAAHIRERNRSSAIQRFVFRWIGILISAGAFGLFGLIRLGANSQMLATGFIVLAIGWLLFTDVAGRRIPAVREWPLFAAFGRFRVWVYSTLLFGIFLGMLGNAAWDGAKNFWSERVPRSKPNSIQTSPPK
jgi:hypothetical protein